MTRSIHCVRSATTKCTPSLSRAWCTAKHLTPATRSLQTGAATVIQLPEQVDEADQTASIASRNADASFEVLGAPFSLLSVKLSPSQELYTRRGTLVGLTGSPENALSTLSVKSPLQRFLTGVPFLYQKITSTSPLTAIIGTNSASSSITTVHLDGRVDWIVAQRTALLAWTGSNLMVRPKTNLRLSLAHWGNSHITGRGLVSLVGKGQVFQINLAANEDYVVHPKHILAYSTNGTLPQPYRFRSNALRFQLPSISSIIPDTRFFRDMSNTSFWRFVSATAYTIRTWSRRTIWGDRLFLRFQGPTTILVQSRGTNIRETLSREDINEIADSPAGALRSVQAPGRESSASAEGVKVAGRSAQQSIVDSSDSKTVKYATVHAGGKVTIK